MSEAPVAIVRISPDASWERFDEVTARAARELGGDWVAKLDGLDQRYWDLRRGAGVVTFHLDTFAGISAFPATDAPDPAASRALLEEVRALLVR